jgi:hypothetical protein
VRFFDFRCRECGTVGEVLLPSAQDILPCSCGGLADRVLTAPFIGNKAKGRYPYVDTQLGITVESPQHRERVAKERGLLIMGPDEHRRALANAPESDPEPSVDSKGWREAAEKAWADIKSGNVPPDITIPTLADVDATVLTSETEI